MRTAHQLSVAPRRRRQARRRRRQSYGISDPGTYSTTAAWWSREHWRSELYADLHSEDVARLRAGVGTRGPISVRACYALGVAISACADGRTGRNAMPGNAALATKSDQLDSGADDYWTRLAASTGYGVTTIQKAEQVLVARGWLVRVRRGKNWLTREERQELWRAGSVARQRRNVWACSMASHLHLPAPQEPAQRRDERVATGPVPGAAPPAVDNRDPGRSSTESGCDLPTTQRVGGSLSVHNNKIFKPEHASRNGPPGRPTTTETLRKRTYRADWRTVQLAKDLRACVYWLRETPHQRIMSALDRFARAGWTAVDIQRELDGMLAARGWEVPSGRVTTTKAGRERCYPLRCPWGYLAMLLRTLEPTDLITRREYEREMRAAQHEYAQLRRTGPECPHGEPAGDVPSPVKGIRACPLCRRAT